MKNQFFGVCLVAAISILASDVFAADKNDDDFKLIGYLDNSGWDNTGWLTECPEISKYDIVVIGFGGINTKTRDVTPPAYKTDAVKAFKDNQKKLGKDNKVLLSWGGEHGQFARFDDGADMDKEIDVLSDRFAVIINNDENIDGIDFDIEGCYPFAKKSETDPKIFQKRFDAFVKKIRGKVNRPILITLAPQPLYVNGNVSLVIPQGAEFRFDDILDGFDYVMLQFYNTNWDATLKPLADDPNKIGEFFELLKKSPNLSKLTKKQLVIGKPVTAAAAPGGGYNNPKDFKMDVFKDNSSGIMAWDIFRDKNNGFNFVNTLSGKVAP